MNKHRFYLLKKIANEVIHDSEKDSESPKESAPFNLENYVSELYTQSLNYQNFDIIGSKIIKYLNEDKSLATSLNYIIFDRINEPIVNGSRESQLLEELYSKLDEASNINLNENEKEIKEKIQERQFQDQEIQEYLQIIKNKEDINEDLKIQLNNLIKFKKEFTLKFQKIEQIYLKYLFYINQAYKLSVALSDAKRSLTFDQRKKLLEKISNLNNSINEFIMITNDIASYQSKYIEQDILLKFSEFKEYNYPLKRQIRQIIHILYALEISQEYVENLTNYLSDKKNFIINKNLLYIFHKKYNLENFPVSDFEKVASGDLNFLMSVCKNDKDIAQALRNSEEHRGEVLSNVTSYRDIVKENLDSNIIEKQLFLNKISYTSSLQKNELIKNLYKTLYRYINNYFEDLNCYTLCNILKNNNDLFNQFIQFYHENIKPINLGMLISGDLLKFTLLTNGKLSKDFNLLLASIKKLGIKSDEQIISLEKRSQIINRIFHNHGYDIPEVDEKSMDFKFEGYDTDLYLSLLKSKWDLDQDLVNKFINVAINSSIDKEIEEHQNKIKSLLVHYNINFDQFRHNLMEIREIVARSAPIPFSFKEKIYQVDNIINIILTKKLISENIEKAKLKDSKLFNLNYNLENGLRFEVLPDKSVEHFTVGAATQCCQAPGGAGEQAMIDSFINPLAGVLTLKNKNQIIAQSYFHYVPQDNGYILDNVEANFSLIKKYNLNLDNLYANLAQKLKQDWNIKYFICGKEYNKLSSSSFGSGEMEEDPRSFDVDEPYSDFNEEDYLDLLRPEFNPSSIEMNKVAQNKLRKIIKMANVYSQLSCFLKSGDKL